MFLELSFAYLVGSIPFGKLLTKFLTNKDITQTGSGNIGATNVYRSVSKKAGVTVIIPDKSGFELKVNDMYKSYINKKNIFSLINEIKAVE